MQKGGAALFVKRRAIWLILVLWPMMPRKVKVWAFMNDE